MLPSWSVSYILNTHEILSSVLPNRRVDSDVKNSWKRVTHKRFSKLYQSNSSAIQFPRSANSGIWWCAWIRQNIPNVMQLKKIGKGDFWKIRIYIFLSQKNSIRFPFMLVIESVPRSWVAFDWRGWLHARDSWSRLNSLSMEGRKWLSWNYKWVSKI